jgi:hypothetical protein
MLDLCCLLHLLATPGSSNGLTVCMCPWPVIKLLQLLEVQAKVIYSRGLSAPENLLQELGGQTLMQVILDNRHLQERAVPGQQLHASSVKTLDRCCC